MERPSPAAKTWIQRAFVVTLWIGAFVAFRSYRSANDLSTLGAGQEFIDAVEMAWWGVLAFGLAYLIRPIVLFPASVITVMGGLLFGPVAGVAVVVLFSNLSALLAYSIGRTLGGAPGAEDGNNEAATLAKRWTNRLRTNSFESVFIMRLLFLPYDLVNYLSGALRIKWLPFIAATALGSLPGTISFVLLGASLERIDEGFGGINPWSLVASVAIFMVSLGIARVVRSRQGMDDAETAHAQTLDELVPVEAAVRN